MENKSVWNDLQKSLSFNSLNKDIDCDVLVIGGGMAGILTAYLLKQHGRNVVLVEAKQIGQGITKNTTAVITAQTGTTYSDLIKMHGIKKAKGYLNANLNAVKTYQEICKKIDCDFEIKPSYIYSLDENMEYELKALKKLDYEAELTYESGLPFPIKSAIKFNDMAQFHPLKFLYSIASELNIYENTFVTDIKQHTAFTETNKITFKHAVVASHFPFVNSTGLFWIKMYQERSYVIALENAGNINGTLVEDKTGGFYFRNYKNLLFVGKGDHRVGTSTKAFAELEKFAAEYYPNAKIKYKWANQDCVTLDSIPYVGKYGNLENVLTLTGFNLWGMTGSMAGAKILCDIICNGESEYSNVFSPTRNIVRAQLFKNLGTALINWIKPTSKRCPHLGCALKYNQNERCWDCKCHGSRFTTDGDLIDNPAMSHAIGVNKHAQKKKMDNKKL